MKTLEPLIEECRDKLGGVSYLKTMIHLGMHRQQWTAIQNGSGVSDANAIRIADFLEIDRMYVIAISNSLSSKDRESKAFWRRTAKTYEKKDLKMTA